MGEQTHLQGILRMHLLRNFTLMGCRLNGRKIYFPIKGRERKRERERERERDWKKSQFHYHEFSTFEEKRMRHRHIEKNYGNAHHQIEAKF